MLWLLSERLDRERIVNAINTVYPTGNLLLDVVFSEFTIYKGFLLKCANKHSPDYMEQEDIEFYLAEQLYDLGKKRFEKELMNMLRIQYIEIRLCRWSRLVVLTM